MRRRFTTLALALGVMFALAVPVGAAELHRPHQGTECKYGIETLHFVNNQLRGYDGDVYLWIEMEGGTNIGPVPAADHPSANKHWWINVESGTKLINAWTTTEHDPTPTPLDDNSAPEGPDGVNDGPGRLVLSDYKCAPEPKK